MLLLSVLQIYIYLAFKIDSQDRKRVSPYESRMLDLRGRAKKMLNIDRECNY